ncbi:hypothetical protein TTHERM_000720140 (macronuclear) [Tetrahymena thermophila SB210]|uniref:Uncharacterized protein n=1 Tax=Tetrahymena thermophila (strain SB210) TaxID=312017 RepID=W7XIX7_TETTS|nr:hypothetical protein TTHERM_000720140 [Tetrahymena thermophila SB210]EWS73684.1 hypothetical protein TTHERM_000720140 [Tetrahymena thermophila SB210]|eukprot:XP_012653814.1 hypothetical protein TTHERM_000720140 [Tetrahymena thermophila SB210]
MAQDSNSGDQTKSQFNLNSSLQSSSQQSTQYIANLGSTLGNSNITTTQQIK